MPTRVEMRIEEFLRGGWRKTISPSRGQGGKNCRSIEMTLVVRGEDDGRVEGPQILQARNCEPREGAGERQNEARQRDTADRARIANGSTPQTRTALQRQHRQRV